MEQIEGYIVKNVSNQYIVKTKQGEYETTARGRFKKQEISPVVGDKVQILVENEESKKAVIEKIETRKVLMKRPKIANITQMVFVVSSKHPKPDLLLLDKQLALAEYLKIKSLIILNKIDLDDKKQFKNIKQVYKNLGYRVIETQGKEGQGVLELKEQLKGEINAFSGNSGVGKSTLINAIFKQNITEEGEISQKNKRGKNTTTAIQLYEIDKNTYIADTPGFSTFDISEIEPDKLDQCFIEFQKYIPECQFTGCTHIKEENCGIKKAIQEGKISEERYTRFCKIYEELKEKEKHKW